jgi:hypothetical protein
MGEFFWIVLKLFWYLMLAYGFILFVSTVTEKDRTIPAIIVVSIIAVFYFWANLR